MTTPKISPRAIAAVVLYVFIYTASAVSQQAGVVSNLVTSVIEGAIFLLALHLSLNEKNPLLNMVLIIIAFNIVIVVLGVGTSTVYSTLENIGVFGVTWVTTGFVSTHIFKRSA